MYIYAFILNSDIVNYLLQFKLVKSKPIIWLNLVNQLFIHVHGLYIERLGRGEGGCEEGKEGRWDRMVEEQEDRRCEESWVQYPYMEDRKKKMKVRRKDWGRRE